MKSKIVLIIFAVLFFAFDTLEEGYPDIEKVWFTTTYAGKARYNVDTNFRHLIKTDWKYRIQTPLPDNFGNITVTQLRNTIDSAFNNWLDELADGDHINPFSFAYDGEGDQSSSNEIIDFYFSDEGANMIRGGCKPVTLHDGSVVQVKDVDILLNSNETVTYTIGYQSYSDTTWDIQSIVTHELGHLFNFQHTQDDHSI